MTTNRERENPEEILPASQSAAANGNGSDQATQTECERLRKRVAELEEQCEICNRALTRLMGEHLAKTDTTTEAELDRMAEEALGLGSFERELQELLQQS